MVSYSFDSGETKSAAKIKQIISKNLYNNNETTYQAMQTHTQTKYSHTDTLANYTKLKTWFRRLLCHPARKQIGPVLQLLGPTWGQHQWDVMPHAVTMCEPVPLNEKSKTKV